MLKEAMPNEREFEELGRDKDLKALLETLHPKAFTSKDFDVLKEQKEWIPSMDGYFSLAVYDAIAKGIMGKAKPVGPAKLWWKLSC